LKGSKIARTIPVDEALAGSVVLMVAELWSGIAQDEFIRLGNGFVFKKEEMLPQ
jgi:hypothetical protein